MNSDIFVIHGTSSDKKNSHYALLQPIKNKWEQIELSRVNILIVLIGRAKI